MLGMVAGALVVVQSSASCVCGCPRDAHVLTKMSEPIIQPNEENAWLGHYKFNVALFQNNIFVSRPSATYVSENCGCGCTIFEADELPVDSGDSAGGCDVEAG